MTANQTIYVVAYGQHKVVDKEYADGFRWEYCEGIALGAFTSQATAEAVAYASEIGVVSAVKLDSVKRHYQDIIEDAEHKNQLPILVSTAEEETRLSQIEKLADLLSETASMKGKTRMLIAEEIISSVERRVMNLGRKD